MPILSDGSRRHFIPAFALPLIPPNAGDEAIIHRCVQLAQRAAGQTRPNPPVGCVITDNTGRTLGEGYHRRAGMPHAEVNALTDTKQRGFSPAGATAYVSLEPCNHYGRTPPCAKALVEAGVSRVVVGMVDPDPRTGGGGIRRLRDHGIHVDVGIGDSECRQLTEGFVSRVLKKRPFGVLKYAMTLDGKIAAENRSSKWITGEKSRLRVHSMRAGMDAIIVGGRTVREDNPRLNVRGVVRDGPLSPIRVVMTRGLDLPLERSLWDTKESETIVFTHSVDGRQDIIEKLRGHGVDIIHIPQLTPDHVMEELYKRGCLNVLWECGGGLASQAIRAGAVQKVHAFIAPKIIGGLLAPSPVGDPAVGEDMAAALQLCRHSVETFDNGDVLISGYVPS